MGSFDVSIGRKRVLSTTDEAITERKRPRISSMTHEFQAHLSGQSLRRSSSASWTNYERIPQVIPLLSDEIEFQGVSRRPRSLHTRSSYSALSRPITPVLSNDDVIQATQEGLAMMRRVSMGSMPPPSSSSVPRYSEHSAKNHFRNGKMNVDFHVHSGATSLGMSPIDWSLQNILVFSRANRVHYKNLSTHEDVGQLCKLEAKSGYLCSIQCAGLDQQNVVAVATNKGYVQIWDLAAKKMTTSWCTGSVTSMQWNGPVLTVGEVKGVIRHFDTRIKEIPQMREQAQKIARHQARISSLAWNVDGSCLASGDEKGRVYCWDPRQTKPLDIGEFLPRRKKMQHEGDVRALAWCPWEPSLFVSGDSISNGTGTIRLWDIKPKTVDKNTKPSNALGKIDVNAQVTSLHFSPHCKELLSTHGAGVIGQDNGNIPAQNHPSGYANSAVVHSVPAFNFIIDGATASKAIEGSVLSPNGTKVLMAIPGEKQMKVWDVWGKPKLRRLPSFMDRTGIR